ncbi:hypothetical protein ACFE04_003431 [Oxalis oulophora]
MALYHNVNNNNNNNKSYNLNCSKPFPKGYKFEPTDFELVDFYLRRKLLKQELPIGFFKEVDVYEYHPKILYDNVIRSQINLCGVVHVALATSEFVQFMRRDDNVERDKSHDQRRSPSESAAYIFTPRNRKYANGTRPDRTVKGGGYWKASGADKAVLNPAGIRVGTKRSLVFYEGTHKDSAKTERLMTEYLLDGQQPNITSTDLPNKRLNEDVLCKIYISKQEKEATGEDVDIPDCDYPEAVRKTFRQEAENEQLLSLVVESDQPEPLAVYKEDQLPSHGFDQAAVVERISHYNFDRPLINNTDYLSLPDQGIAKQTSHDSFDQSLMNNTSYLSLPNQGVVEQTSGYNFDQLLMNNTDYLSLHDQCIAKQTSHDYFDQSFMNSTSYLSLPNEQTSCYNFDQPDIINTSDLPTDWDYVEKISDDLKVDDLIDFREFKSIELPGNSISTGLFQNAGEESESLQLQNLRKRQRFHFV